LFLQNSIRLNLPHYFFDTNANRNPILDFFKKTAKIQPLSNSWYRTYFYFNNFWFYNDVVPLILAQGQNLSLLSTAIEKHITINEPDYFFS
jgi:hypothetical protein